MNGYYSIKFFIVLAYRTELPSRYSADKGFTRTGAESEFQDKLGCELGKKNDAKINVGCLLLRSEINYGNIQLRMTLK